MANFVSKEISRRSVILPVPKVCVHVNFTFILLFLWQLFGSTTQKACVFTGNFSIPPTNFHIMSKMILESSQKAAQPPAFSSSLHSSEE